MEVEGTKYLTMFLLGIGPLILGFLPIKIGKYFDNEENPKAWKPTFISVLLCFGGGLLLATASMHMLPEVREDLQEANIEFLVEKPCAEIFIAIGKKKKHIFKNCHQRANHFFFEFSGFFLIYFIEEMVHYFLDSNVHHHHDKTIQIHKSFTVHTQACEAGLTDFENCSSNELQGKESNYGSIPTNTDECIQEENTSQALLRNFLTVMALSIHCVFEGLAIGLEKEAHDVWILFAAVAAHKFVISFCIGLELHQAKTPMVLYVAYIIIFALVTPIGMGIGIAISTLQVSSAYYVSVAVLQGIAGGTILYIVVFEVLERERSKNVSGLAQLLFIVLGFGVISSIEFLE